MNHRKWPFLIDPFLVEGKRNFKKAYHLARFTDAALNSHAANPPFAAMYVAFHPLYIVLDTEYNDWKSQGGIQKGSTQTLDQLLIALGSGDADLGISSHINTWSLAVQTVYPKVTPTFTAILPHGNAPFQKGDKNARISAVSALSDTLTGFPALAGLKTTVDGFLAALNTARITQQGEISDTGTDSNDVRDAVTAAMVGMFAVYGGLIQHFAATPDDVEAFFDLELLRDIQQSEWTGTIAPANDKNIAKRTLDDQRRVKLINLTGKPLKFYVANEKNDPPQSSSIIVEGNEDETVVWGSLKHGTDSSYLKVFNPDNALEGHYRVEILPEGSDS